MKRSRRGAGICALSFLILGLLPEALSAETVVFRNGHRLLVSSVERAGSEFVLRLPNGGQIHCPRELVDRIEADPEPGPRGSTVPAADSLMTTGAAISIPPGLAPLILEAAAAHDLDAGLIAAMIKAESSFDPLAVSPRGAQGLMQLMPPTAVRFGVGDPFDPRQNINGGAAYLKELLGRFQGNLRLALAAYNAGEGRVEAHGGVPPFPETVQYISRVMNYYRSLQDST